MRGNAFIQTQISNVTTYAWPTSPPPSEYLRHFWTALLSLIGWLMTGCKSIVVSLGQLSPRID